MTVLVSSQDFIGREVIDLKGALVGEIVSLELSLDSWKVTHLNVELDADVEDMLGLRQGFFDWDRHVVSLPIESISRLSDLITIKNEIKELKDSSKANMKVIAEF